MTDDHHFRSQADTAWDDLRIALAVARAGSMARAGAMLGMDPATVSRRVSSAEASLGAILFARSKTGVTLTDAGRALVRRAAEMEGRARRLAEEVAAKGTVAGVVRIITSPWIAARIARVLAPRLKEAHPELVLRLIGTRPNWEATPGEATISLWYETPPFDGHFGVRLGTIDYALYTLRGEHADTPLLMGHHFDDGGGRGPLRNARSDTAPDRWAVSRMKPGSAFSLTATDSLILLEGVRGGLGPALLPVALGDRDPELVRAPPGGVLVSRPLMLQTHPDHVDLARIQAVMSQLRASFAELFERPSGGADAKPHPLDGKRAS